MTLRVAQEKPWHHLNHADSDTAWKSALSSAQKIQLLAFAFGSPRNTEYLRLLCRDSDHNIYRIVTSQNISERGRRCNQPESAALSTLAGKV